MRAEGAALDDAMRLELQKVPGLKVVDVGDQPEVPADSLRKRYRADWIVRGSLDQIGDSVGATVRVVDASNGVEVRSGVVRQASPATLQAAATALGKKSLFASVRYALDSVLLERWLRELGPDSLTAALRGRALAIVERSKDALTEVGPRRTMEELALADSLVTVASARRPSSALSWYSRAEIGNEAGFTIWAARQYYPDSTWLPPRVEAFRRAVPFATEAIRRAPHSADARFMRSKLYSWLLEATADPVWRDSALADLRAASAMAGGRADIWARRAQVENSAGQWSEARFSAEQGEAADYLHTNSEVLLRRRLEAELMLGEFDQAQGSCRSGSRLFPGTQYFIDCEAEVLGYLSSNPRDARQVLALADSLTEHGVGELSPIVPDGLRLLSVTILARGGLNDSAGRLYDRVVSSWHGAVDENLLLNAVYARQALGDMDSALAMTARVVQMDPGQAPGIERARWYQELRRQPGFPDAIKGIAPSERRRP